MDLLALASLLLGIVALAVAVAAKRALAGVERELAEQRARTTVLSGELDRLRSAAEDVPPPPLPKARTDVLQDLREQLRASQHEDDEEVSAP